MTRKDFLKIASTGALGVMLGTPLIGRAFSPKELKDGSQFDVIIVGTGYGASVAALRLAQAGKRCLMLEMGMDWAASAMKFSGMAWAKKQSTWLKTKTIAPFGNYRVIEKFTGALDRTDYENVKIYEGRGIGGGSLVNGGMSVIPRKDYFEEIFPDLDSNTFYSKYFPLANEELGVQTMPKDFYQKSAYYQFSRTGEEEGKKAGYKSIRVPNVYDFEYMRKEEEGTVPKSGLGGEVIYGNNHGKKDLTKTYLKKALDTGRVSILGLHKVEQITQNTDDTYTLQVSEINTKGETIQSKTYSTSKLFLGAGSVGTTKLLLKSKAKGTLPNIDETVGKYWGNNGNTMASRSFVKKFLGHKQSSIPAAGLEKWTKNDDAIFPEIAPFPVGIDLRTSLYLVINRVPKFGTFTYNKKTDQLDLDWGREQNAHMIRNAENFLGHMNDVNGGTRGIAFPKGIDETICYHPLGGCVLGKATDMIGRVNHHKGLYVLDGALVPASIGVNPYVTITALAEYCMEHIIAEDFTNQRNSSVETHSLDVDISTKGFNEYIDLTINTPVAGTITLTMRNWVGLRVAKTTFQAKANTPVQYRWKGLKKLWRRKYYLHIQVGDLSRRITIHR